MIDSTIRKIVSLHLLSAFLFSGKSLRLRAPFPFLNNQRLDWIFSVILFLPITATINYPCNIYFLIWSHFWGLLRLTSENHKKAHPWEIVLGSLARHWCWLLSLHSVIIKSSLARCRVTFLSHLKSKPAIWLKVFRFFNKNVSKTSSNSFVYSHLP